jgi:hypothetical protein
LKSEPKNIKLLLGSVWKFRFRTKYKK